MSLADRKCLPCSGEVCPVTAKEIETLGAQLTDWHIQDSHKLCKSFKFKNFKQAMDLANAIAEVAELEGHHPDLLVRWGELRIDLWTHAIDGLSEADFILAAKIDRVASHKGAHHGSAAAS